MVKYLSFHNSSLALRYFLMSMAKAKCDTPLVGVIKANTSSNRGGGHVWWRCFKLLFGIPKHLQP